MAASQNEYVRHYIRKMQKNDLCQSCGDARGPNGSKWRCKSCNARQAEWARQRRKRRRDSCSRD